MHVIPAKMLSNNTKETMKKKLQEFYEMGFGGFKRQSEDEMTSANIFNYQAPGLIQNTMFQL